MREIKFRAWDVELKRMVTEINLSNYNDDLNGWFQGTAYRVMQYTGLKDKNGKEIYEGDITKGGIIEFNFGKWIVVNKKDDLQSYLLYDAIHDSAEQEVIGNVWENQELLK